MVSKVQPYRSNSRNNAGDQERNRGGKPRRSRGEPRGNPWASTVWQSTRETCDMRAHITSPGRIPCVGGTSTNPDTERIGTPLVIRCSYTWQGPRSCAPGTGYAQLYDRTSGTPRRVDLLWRRRLIPFSSFRARPRAATRPLPPPRLHGRTLSGNYDPSCPN